MKLTDNTCKNAKPTEKLYKLFDGQGLFLEVRTNGSRYWRLKYRFGGKEKLLALGVYPEISLKKARELKDEARKLIQQNIDPSIDKKEKRLKAHTESNNTFESLTLDWHQNWKVDKTEKTANATLSRLERDVFPHIGALPVSRLTPTIILDVVKRVEKRGAYDVARRIKQTCGQILRYGVACGRAERDFTVDIKDAMRPYKLEHFATLEIKELPAFLRKLDSTEVTLTQQTRLAMRFLMLTFVRTSELVRAEWSEFDLKNKLWTIPAHKMKMRRDHIVPLSKQALSIILKLKNHTGHRQWVFPNMAYPKKHMSNGTLTRAIMRMGYKDKMTGHGFRALAMTTIKEKLGYRHEVIDRQLAHAKANKIVAAYDRAEFLDDRTVMMQKYADYIDSITKPEKVDI